MDEINYKASQELEKEMSVQDDTLIHRKTMVEKTAIPTAKNRLTPTASAPLHKSVVQHFVFVAPIAV